MRKILRHSLRSITVLIASFGFVGCAGYHSVNSAAYVGTDAGSTEIQIVDVVMAKTEKKAGQRRVAQDLYQELSRRYEGVETAPLKVSVVLSESQQALSSRRDATVSRWMYFLRGTATIRKEGKVVATIASTADAPYLVALSPVATEANYRQAQDAAASVLLRDLQRQLSIFRFQESQKEPNL